MPLNHIFTKCTAGYKLSRSQKKISQLMTSNFFAKNEKELENSNHAFRIYNQEIGMKFGIEKYAMLVMKSGKRHMTDGMKLPSQYKIRTLGEKKAYKYLGILVADTIKQMEMKDKSKKEYLRRTRRLIETKLSSRHPFKGIYTWVVTSIDIRNPFWSGPEKNLSKWTKE